MKDRAIEEERVNQARYEMTKLKKKSGYEMTKMVRNDLGTK